MTAIIHTKGNLCSVQQLVSGCLHITPMSQQWLTSTLVNSGSIVPADPVDCPKGQDIYNTVVGAAGCAKSTDTLACLRTVPYSTLLNATNSVAGIISYSSIALNYIPRPDGTALTISPELLVASGKYAKVPFIIGSQEDEGTLFSLFQSNIATKAQLSTYLNKYFFNSASKAQIDKLIDTYPDTIIDGSPFRSGILNNIYPQFKRLAAILGDLTFTLTRRSFLNTANMVAPDVPSWSYLSSYNIGLPVLGTFHGSDLLQVFFGESNTTQICISVGVTGTRNPCDHINHSKTMRLTY